MLGPGGHHPESGLVVLCQRLLRQGHRCKLQRAVAVEALPLRAFLCGLVVDLGVGVAYGRTCVCQGSRTAGEPSQVGSWASHVRMGGLVGRTVPQVEEYWRDMVHMEGPLSQDVPRARVGDRRQVHMGLLVVLVRTRDEAAIPAHPEDPEGLFRMEEGLGVL